ncbi:hypothetical protein M1C57_11745 [Rhodococcus pyridinivorans]|uniref:hypothetical protein n=1 Tax=Rhodococcus pyridinivorans TaxID=103816 RepID=UPI001D1583CC|nr:hypothetical protein [Rhodococcus pyridinivorans]UPW02425.1 hypothetical protein M1C57_11745 [Rhodococcus pyridinivorans]WMM72557.1 hypothetical protein RCF27_22505 [Rhodococcus pyridinivorans]
MPSGSAGRGAVAFALSLVYLIWGSIYLAIRLVIEEVPPLGSMGARFLLAALLMAVFLAVRAAGDGCWSPGVRSAVPRSLGSCCSRVEMA